MNSFLIKPKDDQEAVFLKELLNKLGCAIHELSDEELEDAGFLAAMVSEKKEDYVTEQEIKKALE